MNEFVIVRRENKPFSHSEKKPESNDILPHFVEFSNIHSSNSDRRSNATQPNLAYKNKKCIRITFDPGSFVE